jgi:hypothetical protein
VQNQRSNRNEKKKIAAVQAALRDFDATNLKESLESLSDATREIYSVDDA